MKRLTVAQMRKLKPGTPLFLKFLDESFVSSIVSPEEAMKDWGIELPKDMARNRIWYSYHWLQGDRFHHSCYALTDGGMNLSCDEVFLIESEEELEKFRLLSGV
jgi:hypothetical protein